MRRDQEVLAEVEYVAIPQAQMDPVSEQEVRCAGCRYLTYVTQHSKRPAENVFFSVVISLIQEEVLRSILRCGMRKLADLGSCHC